MSREIKFQILYNNKVEGYERLTEKGWEWMWISLNPDNGERWNKGTIQDSHKLIRRQYTGLKDRNGKEVYFKDIVKDPSGNYFVVEWYEQEMRIVLKRQDVLYGFNVPLYEVVGNVFENPELL